MSINRRQFQQLLLLGGAGLAFGSLPRVAGAAEAPVSGGTLNWANYPDPTALIAINTSSGTGQAIGPKINEGLLDFDHHLNPTPLLATSWSVSGDDFLRRPLTAGIMAAVADRRYGASISASACRMDVLGIPKKPP